ncbi:hypothetical protein GE061_014533 [Apolygus lucorum]|uniref:Uncharacterized protein n=1 Tax=Apolygus lucorum TaxID=248454 RepID=A0A8S9XIH0_APOLU|nr:hypothetical protein GE061_014533 [Apolygus lucorum]
MVRNYVKKNGGPLYDIDALNNAVFDVTEFEYLLPLDLSLPRNIASPEKQAIAGPRKQAKKSCTSVRVEEDSEEEDEQENEIETARQEESDAAELEDFLQDMESEEYEEVAYITPCPTNLIPNNYVLVDIVGGTRKTTHFLYACKVDDIIDDDLEVTGLKSVDGTKTKFVLVENDCFSVGKDQVKAILPNPSVEKEGRKILLKFPGSVNVKEK